MLFRSASFSKSTVSPLCTGLDAQVRAFNERPLGSCPFVLVDAMYIKARDGDAIASKAALMVSGINTEGHREVLGVHIGNSESEAFWVETFRWLKGVRLHRIRRSQGFGQRSEAQLPGRDLATLPGAFHA